MISRIWKEEKNTVIGLFISVLAGMLLITTIWKNDYTEDIPFGIIAGKRAGMTVCAVEDAYSMKDMEEKIRLADFYIKSYEELL